VAYRLVSSLGTWDLAEGETLIGRSRACAICFLDGRLSRRHASIQVRADAATISDCGSINGVLIKGRRITAPTMLHEGDEIIVGPCLFRVECDSAPAPHTTTSRRGNQIAQPTTALYTTDAIERRIEDGSPLRRLAPAIAAAVGPETAGQPGSEGFKPSTYKSNNTEAVVPRPSATKAHETEALRPSEQIPGGDALIDAHERASTIPEQPAPALLQMGTGSPAPAKLVVWAGFLDAAQTTAVSVLLAAPVAVLGLALGLQRAGASVVDGLPKIAFDQPVADLGSLIGSVCGLQGLAHTWTLIPHLRQTDHGVPFLIAMVAVMLAALLFLLVHLITTVVATILYGGPFWHRRAGLHIVETRTGLPPGWSRACARWGLMLVVWPHALWVGLRGKTNLADRWTGLEVRRDE